MSLRTYEARIATTGDDRRGTANASSLGSDVANIAVGATNGTVYYGLLRFLSAPMPAGENIISAILRVFQGTSTVAGARLQVELLTTTGGLVAARLRDDDPTVPGVVVSAPTSAVTDEPVDVDITSLVQTWVRQPGYTPGPVLLRVTSSPPGQPLSGNWSIRDRSAGTVTAAGLTVVYGKQPTRYLTPAPARLHIRGGVPTTSRRIRPLGARLGLRGGVPGMTGPVTVIPVTARLNLAGGIIELTGTGSIPFSPAGVRLGLSAGVPALAVTIPPTPPAPPWQLLVTDPTYLQALTAPTITTSTRVEIITEDGGVIARLGGDNATHPGALDGSVSCDSSRAVRWECDLTLDNPDLLPATPYDLLHPLSHNRLRVWWRIRLAGVGAAALWGEIPVGTYYIDMPEHSDDGSTFGLRFRGSDAVAEIKRAGWTAALALGGLYVHEAIAQILTDRAPWVETALTPSTYRVPASWEPGEPGSDPWEDVVSLAHAAGQVAYADRMGVIVTQDRPATVQPRAVFAEGDGAAVFDVAAQIDLDDLANHITVTSASSDVDPPVSGVWTDDDPASPLWVGHGHLYTRRIESGIVTTAAQAANYARNEGLDQGVVSTVQATVLAHPHLDPLETVTITRARANLSGAHSLLAWSLDLGPGGQMQITTTDRKELPR